MVARLRVWPRVHMNCGHSRFCCALDHPTPWVPLLPMKDYINFKLTGRMCASINNASVRWHYSSKDGWPLGLLCQLGAEELQRKWPQEVLLLGR